MPHVYKKPCVAQKLHITKKFVCFGHDPTHNLQIISTIFTQAHHQGVGGREGSHREKRDQQATYLV